MEKGISSSLQTLSESQLIEICQATSLQLFPDIVSVLGYAIQVKQLDTRAKFWLPSLELFTRSARETLPHLYQISTSSALQPSDKPSDAVDVERSSSPSSPFQQTCQYSNIDINIIWTGIIDSIESFLMIGGQDLRNSLGDSMPVHTMSAGLYNAMMSPMSASSSPSSSTDAMSTQASEARLVELLSNHMLYICPNLPNLHDRLFQILIDGCDMVNRESLMKQSYSGLFDAVHLGNLGDSAISELSSGAEAGTSGPGSVAINVSVAKTRTVSSSPNPAKTPENRVRVAKMALPHLLKRCKVVISKFLADDKRSGALPLPATRVVEITYLLEQLKSLRVDSTLWAEPPKVESIGASQRRHLWELFPLLCECITAKEPGIKSIIKSVFLDCGQELGLE